MTFTEARRERLLARSASQVGCRPRVCPPGRIGPRLGVPRGAGEASRRTRRSRVARPVPCQNSLMALSSSFVLARLLCGTY